MIFRGPRPTDDEFDELKRRRDEGIAHVVAAVCAKYGWKPAETSAHATHSGPCYCACPDGPCQHIWDGAEHVDDEGGISSATCSRCGAIAIYHDMRVMP